MALSRAALALRAADRVFRHGDDKHGHDNWHDHADFKEQRRRHLAALVRHLGRFLGGDEMDESGEPALAHVAARALMALEFDVLERRGLPACGAVLDEGGPRLCDKPPGHEGPHQDGLTALLWNDR